MFEKVLIANRGEIALRVARACRELGVKSVAVYSTVDKESAVVRFADEAVCVGPPAPGKSYLHIPNIIGAAQKTGRPSPVVTRTWFAGTNPGTTVTGKVRSCGTFPTPK